MACPGSLVAAPLPPIPLAPCAWPPAGPQRGYTYRGAGVCQNEAGGYPAHWWGKPAGGKGGSVCMGLCSSDWADGKCTGFAHRASDGYCEVFGNALPKTKEGAGSGALEWLDGMTWDKGSSTDDVLTRVLSGSDWVCYARQFPPARGSDAPTPAHTQPTAPRRRPPPPPLACVRRPLPPLLSPPLPASHPPHPSRAAPPPCRYCLSLQMGCARPGRGRR